MGRVVMGRDGVDYCAGETTALGTADAWQAAARGLAGGTAVRCTSRGDGHVLGALPYGALGTLVHPGWGLYSPLTVDAFRVFQSATLSQ